jgi:hypothetical protein
MDQYQIVNASMSFFSDWIHLSHLICRTYFVLIGLLFSHAYYYYCDSIAVGGELVLPDDYFHIVIAGQFSPKSIEGFLKEFYNEVLKNPTSAMKNSPP